jgi:hypothetical protein
MRFIQGSRKIVFKSGEDIRFEVSSLGTLFPVNYDLAGEQGTLDEDQPLQFTFDRQRHHQRQLAMSFQFSEPAGGEYQIRVVGAGQEVASYSIKQGDTPFLIMQFGLEGDPTTDY